MHQQQKSLLCIHDIYRKTPIQKRSTIGIIIDCSGSFKDNDCKYRRKIKIVDETFNMEHNINNLDQIYYLNVYVIQENRQQLPHPFKLGDILYLRRFKFKIYDKNFQAWSYSQPFCSWALSSSTPDSQPYPYQQSRQSISFSQQELNNFRKRVEELKKFREVFFMRNSVLNMQREFFGSKDTDLIVKVIEEQEKGCMVETINMVLYVPLQQKKVVIGSYAKLRGLYTIIEQGNKKMAHLTPFSSLITIPQNSLDENMFDIRRECSVQQFQKLFIKLSDINKAPKWKHQHMKYKVKVEVADVVPPLFVQAFKLYHKQRRIILDHQSLDNLSSEIQLVYNVKLIVLDAERPQRHHQFFELLIWDDIELIPRVKLAQLNKYTTFEQQNFLYKKRREQLLNAQNVQLLIEVQTKNEMNLFIVRQIINVNK